MSFRRCLTTIYGIVLEIFVKQNNGRHVVTAIANISSLEPYLTSQQLQPSFPLSCFSLYGTRQSIVCRTSANRLSNVSQSFVERQLMALRLIRVKSRCKGSRCYSPKSVRRPFSSPLKPMKLRARSPAVMSTMLMPCMPFGIFTNDCCSRIPAKSMRARAKPRAVEKA